MTDLLSLRRPDGYGVIIADPPWAFTSNSDDNPGRNAKRHYPCMKLADICALPVKEVAAKDALLLLWVTAPFAELAFEVVHAWGFKYVSQVVWTKQRIGTGFWARNRHEPVYICKRGKIPCPKPSLFPDSIIAGLQREHSRKPDDLHVIVETRLPELSKLEMFARQSRTGWTSFGNETDKFLMEAEPEYVEFLGRRFRSPTDMSDLLNLETNIETDEELLV